MIYLDTSLIMATLANEADTAMAQEWLVGQSAEQLRVSDWVVTEVSSAFAKKLRMGHIELDHRARALTQFNALIANSLRVIPIKSNHFRIAAGFADQHLLALRSADALHLAIASDIGATLATMDKKMAEAGNSLGVPTHFLG